jgi:hypothetical protein
MGKYFLYVVVLVALGWSGYAGFDLIVNSKTRYAPESVFNEEDRGVLLVRQLGELKYGDFIDLTNKNPFSRELIAIHQLNLGRINFYLSSNRAILLLEKKGHWKKSEIEALKKSIKIANTSIKYDGVYALLTKEVDVELTAGNGNDFANGDKKASANYWDLSNSEQVIRTDIYALNSGYFQYQSSNHTKKFGKAVADKEEFSAVLPQNIEKYEFFERFYASEQDSVYAFSPLSEWVDKGFVLAEFNNQQIVVSDYRAQQVPSLVLLETASNADSVSIDDNIKLFKGVRLTANFPRNPEKGFYLIEIEDKTIFTEGLELAKKIQIAYQMGETLGLNQLKSEQLFEGLPTYTNYRKVERSQKTSITFKNKLQFAVTTAPPGEQLIIGASSNWTNGELENCIGFEFIPDHLRGGHSLFAYNKAGEYVLINNNGNVVWKGRADTSLIDHPQVIDIYENDKHQVLFTTHKSVNLIDLNGNDVGNFPYKSDYRLSSSVSYFRWKNTTRFLVGNSKGELAMLNTGGSELNIIQASTRPLINVAFALNINGNLRGWCLDDTNEKLLTYLEKPVKTERLGKSKAVKFEKLGSEVMGYFEQDGYVFSEGMLKPVEKSISEGQLISSNEGLAVRKNNNVTLFNRNGQLQQSITLEFNEVASVFTLTVNKVKYILVLDYFKNNIYCYNTSGELISGFPKEGTTLLKGSHNELSNELNIYTIISNSVVCHKIKLAQNT